MKPLALILALGGCSTSALPELLVDREGEAMTFYAPEKACITCHPQHVTEWGMSPHAYAMRDPVFHAMVRVGQEQSGGRLGQFCVQCHSPIGMAQGQTRVTEVEGVFQQNLELDAVAMSGVSCDICHSVTDVLEPRNARMVYTPNGTYRGPIQDPLGTPAHDSVYSPLHESSDLCGSCHAVVTPAGVPVEETFGEWAASAFAGPDGQTCQGCHMPTYTGEAALDSGQERTLHRHTFVGVDVSLLPPEEFSGYYLMRDLAAELLRSSAHTEATFDPAARELTVDMQNLTGHALPSGATAERQLWVEVVVTDPARSRTWYESGTLDANGDLRDTNPLHSLRPGSDPDLVKYGQDMLDASGSPALFPWQARAVSNHLLMPDQTDVHTYRFDEVPAGDVRVTVRVLFRTFPPYFLRALEDLGGLSPDVKRRVPTVVLFEQEFVGALQGPPFAETPIAPTCQAGDIVDCQGLCWPGFWLGDGTCDEGVHLPWGNPDFACTQHGWDQGDCEPPPPGCHSGEVLDCNNVCRPRMWLGDGTCDNGTAGEWGSPDFDCDTFAYDHGDCELPVFTDPQPEPQGDCIQAGWVPDCAGVCYPGFWVHDGFCDDGSEQRWGAADFSCSAFGQDGGDCP